MEGFETLSTWVSSFTTMFGTMFSSLSTVWVLYVPLGIGVFGIILAKIRGVLWSRKGKKRGG